MSDEAKQEKEEEKKTGKAKLASLIGQIVAALWVCGWCAFKFITSARTPGAVVEVSDVIFSGLAIAACFSPVYFSILMDKIKELKVG